MRRSEAVVVHVEQVADLAEVSHVVARNRVNVVGPITRQNLSGRGLEPRERVRPLICRLAPQGVIRLLVVALQLSLQRLQAIAAAKTREASEREVARRGYVVDR